MARDDTGPYFATSYLHITRQDVWNEVVRVRVEECRRYANLSHDVYVVVARPFLHATTGPSNFLRRVLPLGSSHTAPCRSAPRHIRRHPTIPLPGRESMFFTMFLSLFQEGANFWMWYLRSRMSVSFLDNRTDVAFSLRYVGRQRS